MLLHLTPFTTQHYPTYRAWYSDPTLAKVLGYVDEEWLHYILTDNKSREYAALQDGQLVGVVGLELPEATAHHIAITDIAVHPERRRSGIGTQILQQLPRVITPRPGGGWLAYVDRHNDAAQRFFARNGWSASNEAGDDMIRFLKQ